MLVVSNDGGWVGRAWCLQCQGCWFGSHGEPVWKWYTNVRSHSCKSCWIRACAKWLKCIYNTSTGKADPPPPHLGSLPVVVEQCTSHIRWCMFLVTSTRVDLLSRGAPFRQGRRLHPWVVAQIWERFGNAAIDLYAFQENAHCRLFFCTKDPSAPLGKTLWRTSDLLTFLYAFPPVVELVLVLSNK